MASIAVTLTWVIEIGVGIACFVAVLALRDRRLRLIGALLFVAGLAAIAHATFQLVRS